MTDKTETPAAKAEAPKTAAPAPAAEMAKAAAPVVKAAEDAVAKVVEAAAPAVRTATAAPAAKPARKARKARTVKAARPARKVRAAKAAPARKARAAKAAPVRTVRKAQARAAATIVKTVKNAQTNSNEGTKIMKNEANKVADRIQAVFGDVNERAKTAIERNSRVAEDMTDLTKGNIEAFVASTKVAAKGVEKIGQEVAEYSRKHFEDASAAIKGFADVKSPADLFRLQGEFARTQFDSVIAESSKLSETMIKLAGDMFEPITSRYSVAAERVKNAVAL
ncbi:MAG TPA: phasin family protein [Allosphingosinicella sp.]